jgi:hypothetical protein
VIDEYADTGEASIEDLFSEAFYLELVSRAYGDVGRTQASNRIDPGDIAGDSTIVERLEEYFEEYGIDDGSFDRSVPALYLQENADELDEELDKESVRAFTRLFKSLNTTLTSFDSVDTGGSSFLDVLRSG